MSGANDSLDLPLFPIEPERYEFRARPIHAFDLPRREFFKLLGAGIAVFAVAKNSEAGQETAPGSKSFHNEELPGQIRAWLHIGEDGTVTGFTGKAELGQNARTSIAQTIADELGVSLQAVRLVMADTALTPFDAGTFGSRTTPTMTPQFRRVAAAARGILVATAAEEWSVEPGRLLAGEGKVTDPVTGRSKSYSELARGKSMVETVPAGEKTTPPARWKVAGQPVSKVGARAFVTGSHRYTVDLAPPGLLHGKVLRPPSFGATIQAYDDSAARKIGGVWIVRDGDFVGAAAPTALLARQALEALRVEWSEKPQISGKEIYSYLKKNALPSPEGKYRKQTGDVDRALASAAHKLEATYTVAYIAHAPLEPRAALAEWSEGKLTVWTGTQRPFFNRDELADLFHLSERDVRVIVPDTGSAYGGKHTSDAAIEAARLARAAGKPVKVVWTREEEFTWAYFRPAGVLEVRAGFEPDGSVTAWDFHNYHSGQSAIETPYAVPNQRTEYHATPLVLRSGSYRGLAATANHFARETHMDALAALAGMDPVQFRLKNITDPRLRAVLLAAASSFGWPRKKSREGQGFGVAVGFEKGSYVGTCAEISVEPASGQVRVVKLTEAFECGAILNPDGLRNQTVGAMIQGIGGALFEAIEFDKGRIENPHFSTYRLPRFRDLPEIEVQLIERPDLEPAGAGETPIMAVAPAIGNAIFQATGKRLSSLPLAPNGLKV